MNNLLKSITVNKILIALFILALAVALFRNVEQRRSSAMGFKNRIAVLSIESPIVFNSTSGGLFPKPSGVKVWSKTVRDLAEDPSVSGLLLRVNSPGGTVAASQEMLNALKVFKDSGKKIVVSVMDLCASGAYYISLPADAIVANRGSLVGSIGVILQAPEFSELMKKLGIEVNTIKSGAFKDILSSSREMTEAERASLQSVVNSMYSDFLEDVLRYRGGIEKDEAITKIADGRVLHAQAAIEHYLIDEIGDYYQAKEKMASLLELSESDLQFFKARSESKPVFMDFESLFRDILPSSKGPSVLYQY